MENKRWNRRGRGVIHMITFLLLFCVFFYSILQLYGYYSENKKGEEEFALLANRINEENVTNHQIDLAEEDKQARLRIENCIQLAKENSDMVGYINIEGTTIQYPVMATKEKPDYYLHHNFYKENSKLGVPYIDERCDVNDSDNLIIYGHHIKGKRMFGALLAYEKEAYYKEHKTIRLDTLSEEREYEILAVFKTTTDRVDGFDYNNFIHANNKYEFTDYIEKCKELSLYETGISAQYGNRLLTLSTCEYSKENGRFVIVARNIVK